MPGKPRKRYGKPLDLLQLKTLMSETIRYLSTTLDSDASREMKLRACSAMAANAGVYRQLLEGDMEQRLAAVEARLEAHGKSP